MTYIATRDAITSANLAAGEWKAVGGGDHRPWYIRGLDAVRQAMAGASAGKANRIPGVIYEEHLEGVFRYYHARFGHPRLVGNLMQGPNVTVGA